jgi:hypothetical protein
MDIWRGGNRPGSDAGPRGDASGSFARRGDGNLQGRLFVQRQVAQWCVSWPWRGSGLDVRCCRNRACGGGCDIGPRDAGDHGCRAGRCRDGNLQGRLGL